MDLLDFGKEKKEIIKKLIFEDDDVKIHQYGDKKIYFFKTKNGLKKYQNETFFNLTHSCILNDTNDVLKFLKQSGKDKVEGIMLKNLNSGYEAGLRVGGMYKLKQTKEDLDLVILGAEMGTGKRGGYFSSFIVGIQDKDYTDEEERFLEIGKVGSGLQELGEGDISMTNLFKLLKPLKIYEKKQITYFKPKIVIQIKYQDIQISTTYNSGFALRFPRLLMLREDKGIDEISSIDEIRQLI